MIKKWVSFFLTIAMVFTLIPQTVVDTATATDARDELVLFGDASRQNDDCIELTPLATWKSGSTWYGHQIDVTSGFETSFDFWAGGGRDDSYGGADGICLTFSEETGLGSDGEYLGFVSGSTSYGVELDSYPENPGDPDGKHVAIINDSVSNHLQYVLDDRVDDSEWHSLKVTYDYSTTTLTVELDDEMLLTDNEVNMANYMYLGISAATGGGYNRHLIRNFYIEGVVSEGESFLNNPVIVIPGIMGSRLFTNDSIYDDSTIVWDPIISISGITQLENELKNSNTLYVRPCENQNVDLGDDPDSTVDDYGREYGAQDAYKNLVDALCEIFSYKDETNYRPIYVFSYDWRKSNSISASKLKEEIENILVETGANKVDLVCHSMGGLVASKYYAEYSSEGNVNKIITCGTPYEGAPKLINSVMNWDVLGEGANIFNKNNFSDLVLAIFGSMNKSLKASFLGVTELTPTENYVSEIAMQKDSAWPFSLGDYKISYSQYADICEQIFGTSNYNEAVEFQKSLLLSSGYNQLLDYKNAYFVIGTNHKTISSIKFQLKNNDVDQRLYESDLGYDTLGDGTVPYLSASIMEKIEKLDSSRWETFNADHGETQSKDECIKWLTDVLKTGDSSVQGESAERKMYTVIRVACPVNVMIETGGETLTSSDENFSVESSYGRMDVIGENDEIKMFCIDSSNDYNIVIDGTDTGTMDYTIRFFSEDGELSGDRTVKDVPITEDTIIYTNADESEKSILRIDEDGDGIIDSSIEVGNNQGDVNGDGKITLLDAQITLKAALNIIPLTKEEFEAADVNKNESVTLTDAQTILRAALNIISLE